MVKKSVKYYGSALCHSSGPWKEHKYSKVVDGVYYYDNEMANHVANKDYGALQNTVNDMAKNGYSPEEIQKMLNGNIYDNDMKEAYAKGDYATIQDRVNKLQQMGSSPEDIKAMLDRIRAGGTTTPTGTKGVVKATKSSEQAETPEHKSIKGAVTGGNTKAVHKSYAKGDSDFDDDKYSKQNHIKDTDFYSFKRKDGTSVVLLEDEKWELPKDQEVTNAKKKKLTDYYNKISKSGGRLKVDNDFVTKILNTADSAKSFKGSAKRR